MIKMIRIPKQAPHYFKFNLILASTMDATVNKTLEMQNQLAIKMKSFFFPTILHQIYIGWSASS